MSERLENGVCRPSSVLERLRATEKANEENALQIKKLTQRVIELESIIGTTASAVPEGGLR